MFNRLLSAYKEHGFAFHVGNNNCLCAALAKTNGEFVHTGGGISITDIAFFLGLSKVFIPTRILCIGNASGYGTFCIAEIFPNIHIDVIDAEIEGGFNRLGSELTRQISSKHYGGQVNLLTGFCPDDLGKLLHKNRYDLIFLDGLHTDEQQLRDYNGLVPFAANACVMYLHDVDLLQMQKSYHFIKNNSDGFKAYNVDFTAFGCKALVRNLSTVEDWLQKIDHSPLAEHSRPVATLRAKEVVQPLQADQIPNSHK